MLELKVAVVVNQFSYPAGIILWPLSAVPQAQSLESSHEMVFGYQVRHIHASTQLAAQGKFCPDIPEVGNSFIQIQSTASPFYKFSSL